MFGFDSECPCPTTSLEVMKVSIIQISGEEDCFIFDMDSLRDSPLCDSILAHLFSNAHCLGFSFKNDYRELENSFPSFQFYREIRQFTDI